MKLYRYHKVCYGEQMTENNVNIYPLEYEVIRETNCFYIIKGNKFGTEKRVSKNGFTRYAWPTLVEALENFKQRLIASKRRSLSNIRYCDIALCKVSEYEESKILER